VVGLDIQSRFGYEAGAGAHFGSQSHQQGSDTSSFADPMLAPSWKIAGSTVKEYLAGIPDEGPGVFAEMERRSDAVDGALLRFRW
jgi:hypothetical protein